MPVQDVAEPFVDCDDVADVAVAALTNAGHAGHAYEVTGPRLLTFTDVASILSEATGRDIEFASTSEAEYRRAALGAGVPPDDVAALVELFTAVLDGRNAHVADGVEQALGRPPRDFGTYALAVARTGVWNPLATGARQ